MEYYTKAELCTHKQTCRKTNHTNDSGSAAGNAWAKILAAVYTAAPTVAALS